MKNKTVYEELFESKEKYDTKKEFFDEYSKFSDFEKEMLYKQTLANEKLEKIRENTSFYTWLIIISIVAYGILLWSRT